jgi:hypothetical protein
MRKEAPQPKDQYQVNFERFVASLYEGHYQVVSKTDTRFVLHRTETELFTGDSNPYKALFDGPDLGDVTYRLTISLDDTGRPVFTKKAIEWPDNVTGLDFIGPSSNYVKNSFNISYREPHKLKLDINGTWYYWENKNGKLVLSDIR